ncbi:sugar phosphate nucleotidyltransferase [Streptomyces sp. MB09-02B]|uniref:sugar phosphate nucleotidyltransferase n=1 Tax=Streptomyces sp. MB09-02B TaxID=3028667 RepID=UPI0029BDA5C7|nr:sugar phosphate nucleotidyltransferase [Streptomyces sp. MB09-02B]MDX3640002.1 NTP transferase domain-containing protein [Streptomyces sp. MB09-02B]
MNGPQSQHGDPRTPGPGGLQTVVLAGGRATRLGRLAVQLPKIMQPVAGRPFLDTLLEPLLDSGLLRFHFCLGHLAAPVLAHLRDMPAPVEIMAQVETVPRGTAGALRAGAHHLDEVFLLVLGDTHLPIRYTGAADWLAPGDEATMVVTDAPTGVPPNTTVRNGRVTAYQKTDDDGETDTRWTDTGVCVLRRSALDHVAGRPDPVDLGELYRRLVARRTLAAHRIPEPFTDIGTPERYAEFRARQERCAPAEESPCEYC